MTTCNAVKEELVAYRDGELLEQDRERVAAHLLTCAECAREEAQLAQVEYLFSKMERITPSPDFAATFWKRLEQEQAPVHVVEPNKPPVLEPRLVQWWRGLRERFTSWQIAPMLAATASVLVLFSYLLISPRTPIVTSQPAKSKSVATKAPEAAPTGLTEKLNFFLHYPIIADLDRLSHFEEITAVDLSQERKTEVAQEEEVPPDLLKNPGFFAHYPMLKKMEQLQNLEAVLDTPPKENEHDQG